MKVYCNGLNLHEKFPNTHNIVSNFIDFIHNLTEIEVSYYSVVLLVADALHIKGATNKTVEFGTNVKQISCNEDKILALLDTGDLIKITEEVTKVPKLPDMDDAFITKISLGSKMAIALTNDGRLYNIPNKLDFVAKDIVDVRAGREHCLLLHKNGNVFSFGRGSRGQLGHSSLEEEEEPRLIEALAGIRIVKIAAGGWHSCALSTEGDLYVWGWNSNGQLGLSDSTTLATPQPLDLEFNVKEVACGGKHSVVLTDRGELYGCGWNKYGQLKGSEVENFFEMTFLKDFSGEEVVGLKCGPWNSVVLVNETKVNTSF